MTMLSCWEMGSCITKTLHFEDLAKTSCLVDIAASACVVKTALQSAKFATKERLPKYSLVPRKTKARYSYNFWIASTSWK